MAKPALVFCPGAWYPANVFDSVIEKLRGLGYSDCTTIAFPAIHRATEVKSLEEDIKAVKQAVVPRIEGGQEVVVIIHSWAGIPASSALVGLGTRDREREGKPGGVLSLCYIASFLPQIGESLIDCVGGILPDWQVADPIAYFFHDVVDSERWAEALRPHAIITKESPATGTAYLEIPTTYVVCEYDRALPVVLQDSMIERARAAGADIKTERLKLSHSPWLVEPDTVVPIIRKAGGEML